MEPRATVIVPVKDDAERLELCLAALDAQTLPAPFEVLVVDNGSAVPPVGVVERHPRARLLHERAPTSYAARNAGVAAARGRLLAFTDSDCIPAPDWLERAQARLAATPGECFVGGAVEVFVRTPAAPTPVELYELVHAFPQQAYVERSGFAVTANLVVARDVFARVGRFDETLVSGGDMEWGQRAVALGVRPVYAAEARVAHPARRSWAEMRGKLRRRQLGLAQVNRAAGLRPLLRTVPRRLLRPPLRSTVRRLDRLPYRARRERLACAAVTILVHYASTYEMVRAAARRRRTAR